MPAEAEATIWVRWHGTSGFLSFPRKLGFQGHFKPEQTMESNPEESTPEESNLEDSGLEEEESSRFLIFLKVSCPACGARGAIRWDKLNHVHVCRRCSRFVGVNPSGGPVEVIRTRDNRWVAKEVHAARSSHARAVRLVTRCLLPALAAAVAILLTVRLSSRPASARLEVELPRELKPRAELLTKAWLKRDWSQMRLLVKPGEDRNLYRWSVRSPPPIAGAKEGQPDEMIVDATVLSVQLQGAQVRVQIRGLPETSTKGTFEFLQLWEDREGTWFFIVPAPQTSANAPRGPLKPPVKGRPRDGR